jgi:ribosomal protein S18 acetylase RimI-like enzyme
MIKKIKINEKKQNQFKICNLNINDLSKFVSLWNQNFELLTTSKFKMDFNKAHSGFIKKMFIYFGLFLDENLIGFILLKSQPNLFHIKHMLIDKKYREKHLGSFFLNEVINRIIKRNTVIKVEVLKNNFEALRFFQNQDFKIIQSDKENDQYILKKKYV